MASRIEVDTASSASVYPLCPMQEGMLFHSVYGGQPGVDILQIICDWQEEVDTSVFTRAWQLVAERHSILRTSFTWERPESPRQCVHETVPFSVREQDWSHLSSKAQEKRLEEFLQADRRMTFDLKVAPLMRVALIRLGPARYRFVWTIHHLLVDSRSFVIVLNDLFVIYQSLLSGQELSLKPAPGYREYIDWLQEQDWSEAERFWRERLEGFTTPTSLSIGGHASNGSPPGANWAEEETVLAENLICALRKLAKDHGLTLNAFFQGAWSVVLSRYSGEEDVVFGAVKSCRHLPISRPEESAGPFINTLPIRVRCTADQGLIEWLKTIREQWVALRRFEQSPLAKVQSWSQVPAGRALFETILNVQDPAWDAVLHARGKHTTNFRIRNHPNCPLALDVYVARSARFKLIYNGALLPQPAVKRMLGHLRTVLESMACAPQQRVGNLPLLTEPEQLELLEKWNATQRIYPATDCVHRLFEEQVKRSPEALAVSSDGIQISYRQLNERANQVAHRLRQFGVGPEARVGICMERSAENVIGLLGILKAGSAYVPLDPEYPTDRLAFMISDAKIGVLLTEQKWLARLPRGNAQLVCLEEIEIGPAPADMSQPRSEATPQNLAYVIYTSGSTGTPKGVEIEHQGVVNLIRWHQERYELRPEDRATQLANLSFDASVWELWPYLTAGASVHIPDKETRLNPGKLLQWLAEQKITLTFLPTPLAETIMEGPWPEETTLRALLTGGDRLHRAPKAKLPFELVNHYGPTENSVVTTAAVVEPQREFREAPPIGRPIANTRLYVLDGRMRPVPVGVPGELYIAGAGLARGYLGQPKLTAEKFIANPFCDGPYTRLYRTGDLVRYREDGNVEFLGRIDQQVKLRGHRIELGEIEAVLSAHAEVREAVVVAREDGETRLAAYLVVEKINAPTATELRDYLKQTLPEYMVPSAFVFLDKLPLTSNGKVDRKRLPAPDCKAIEKNFVEPRNHLEEVLAGIWCEVLHLKRVGVHDNFFQLGGHSLLATQVISRVRNALGVELPLQAVFEEPTVEQFAERLKKSGGAQSSSPDLIGMARDGELALSFTQERLCFLEQLEPGLAVYNVPIGIGLQGKLDIAALERSLNALAARHGSLRTSFANAQGRPAVQRAKAVKVELPVVELESLSTEEQRAETEHVMAKEAAQPFDLSQAPLLRTKLLRLGTQKHILLLTTHHIVTDGWSLAILYQELRELYEAYALGRSPSLPELPLEFEDYAKWQREWLQGEVLEEQLAFWKRQLQGPLPALDLPLDHPRPARQSHRGNVEYFALPNSLCADLKTLCRQEDVTLFMLLFATFQTLLHRYSGQDDIVTGTTVAGRTRSEIEGLVGLFLNTLALRADMSGEVTFRGLLQQVRKVALEAYAHQDAPFEKVVEALGVERDLSRSPVFQTMFVLQKAPLPPVRAGELEWRSVPVHSGTSKFDLTLSLEEAAEGLSGYVEYDCDLFESDTVLRMLGHFQTLLQAVVANPDQKLGELPLLTTAERQHVLVEWNGAAPANSGKDLCLHQLIEEQAARTPNHPAIAWQQQTLTYHELNRRANQLAHHLRAMGVGPDVLVALFVERSPEMLVDIVGILKAAGAYVPLDPDYPKERLASILEDSKPLIVLTQQSLVNELPSFAGQSICLDADWAEIAGQSEQNLDSCAKPEHLAYVLFTSGSTGRPKGVALEHRSAVNFVLWAKQIFTPQELAGVLFSTSICFDLSVFEIFVTLSAGGTIILAPNALHLPTLSEREQVTLINTVPSVIAELLRMDALPASVRTVNLAGEALSDRLVEQLYATANVDKVYNLYGPTETTTYSTYTLVRRGSPVTIGRPIADTQCYILDPSRNPVPIGVTGELYISGTGLARGYYGHPELTEERFIPNPFSQESGGRMYRTGDLCRWTPDGNIQYLGRADHQVKLRGLRIELGEVEHTLVDDKGIKDAVVKIWEDHDSDKRLVAYYIPSFATPLKAGYLREILKAKLPDYMVPSHFVEMEAFPLTPNGKLDRKALPAPEVTAYARGYEPPLGEIESTLAQIWCDVLKVERVGRHDHFFDLGGHSLLTIKTLSRIRDVFEVDLPTRTLFEKPTLAEFAKVVTGAKGSAGNIQRIEPRPQSGPCALSFAQERFWLLHQLAPASPVYNILDMIRFKGTYEAEAMRRALKELVRRHQILRTVFADSDEQPMQIVLPTVDLTLSELDLSALPQQEREREWIRVVRDEGRKPFDLSQAPLLRGTMVHQTPQEHQLLLTLHHIIADESSMEVLHQEINQLYAAFSQGQPSPLPELPIQYADFAFWQRDWLQEDVRQVQLAYWKETLAGAPSLLELPTDKPRPPGQSFRGATETFALPKDLLQRLKALGRQHQVTLFMTLEASFAALLHRYTGQDDILVGTPVSGRPHSETERLIGCFLNTVVLRAQFTDDLTFRSLLHQVRERALGAYAHQDLPFDRLVAELAPERDPGRTPLFQVMFTLYNTGGVSQTSKVSGIRELETGTSKFDLTLSISETEDGLEGIIEYSTDLFESQTIRRLHGHYGTLLEEITRDPEQRISKIPILAASERHQILHQWNNTARNYPKDQCLHHLFEKMANRATSRTAIECGGRSLTYSQLNAQANRLANYLIESGVTPNNFIGIYLERSLDLIVGLLAILKAGASYVPMDPSFPPDRLAYMMNNANISLLLTQSSLLGGVPPSGRKVFCLDIERESIERKDCANPNVVVRPSNLAYTIYTSGSTGEPKGVMIEHGALVNFLVSMQREPGFDETDVLVAVTTISFDIAALEIFLPLISGGKLVLASRDDAIDGSLLLQKIRTSGATMLQATPATWKLMLEAGWENTPGLKMLCGGEAFSKDLANQMLERGGELWNMYGPTETTIWSAVRRIEPGPDPVLIGPPIANTQLYVVDKELEPVPIGVAGELLIGGDGLSRGYLNRPELTAERFIENPFSGSGSRVYKTGDLARFHSDGGIEFLGRLDFQVKVRGYRIELGEIECVLTQHAGAKDAVAMTWEDQDGDNRLVAYYIPKADRPVKARDLGKILREKLPDYMIPSCFVELEAFPLTPNGKINRKALPEPSMGDGSLGRVADTPQTPTQEMVLGVFRAALDRTDIGVFDSFFDLGGHSLMAARLMSRLRAVSGMDLPLRDLFARPTVAGLAEAIDALQWLQKSRPPTYGAGIREEIVL